MKKIITRNGVFSFCLDLSESINCFEIPTINVNTFFTLISFNEDEFQLMDFFKLDTAIHLFTSNILVLQFTNILVFQFLKHPRINQVCRWRTHQNPSAIHMSTIWTPNIFQYFTCQRCPQPWIPMSICSSHGSVHYLHVHNVETPASPYLTSVHTV